MSTNTAPYMAPALVANPLAKSTKNSTATSAQLVAANAKRKTIIITNPTTGLTGVMAYVSHESPCTLDDMAIGPGNSITIYRAPVGAMYTRTETLTCKLNVREYE